MLRRLLVHPLTRTLNLDSPEAAAARRQILCTKPFLRAIYLEWYDWLRQTVADLPPGPILELGSGGGFLHTLLPNLIASDLLLLPDVDAVLDARRLPFARASLSAILMTNVLHHIPHPRSFFSEAARCVQRGGKLAMIEPWNTPWAAWVYTHLHHEPFDPRARSWEFPEAGPLSGANGALPWLIFHRDRNQFAAEFPQWQLLQAIPHMPLRYLLSGGLSLRSLAPGWTFGLLRQFENLLAPWFGRLGMFAQIVLQRR